MNFDFTEAEQTFAHEVRRFLGANPPDTFLGVPPKRQATLLSAQGWLSMCCPKALGVREQPMFM